LSSCLFGHCCHLPSPKTASGKIKRAELRAQT